MTPKEKAKELIATFNFLHDTENKAYIIYQTPNESKRCALIAVEFAREFITGDLSEAFDKFIYLQDIKEQIEKL